MVQLIAGNNGKGKTRYLLDEANKAIKEATGNIVYLDKDTAKMYDLNNRIRMINMTSYPVKNSAEFVGFVCGILSQDHDLQYIYADNFRKVARIDEGDKEVLSATIAELEEISKAFNVDFIISIALDKEELSAELQEKVVVAL